MSSAWIKATGSCNWQASLLIRPLDPWLSPCCETEESACSRALLTQQENSMVLPAPASKDDHEHQGVEIYEEMPNWYTISDTRCVYLPQRFVNFAPREPEDELLQANEGQKGEENRVMENPFLRIIKGKDWIPEPLLVPKGSRRKKNNVRVSHSS